MRKRNRKVKVMGLAGMLVVGLAVGSLPVEPVSAANGWEEDLSLYAKSVTASSVTISIGSSGNATLSPGRGSNGTALGTVKRTASVQIGATDGYTIKVSGNPDLTGDNASNKIASVSSATTLKQMSNQWGWYSAEGDVNCDEAGTYRAMSTTGETVSSGVLSSAATKTVTMCFGANVSTDQAADNYSNTVTVSAVAEPRTVVTSTKAFGGITYMQDMTVNACQNASVNETAQLIDRRDSKKYWVTKMLDGNCWMSQNLDLDIVKPTNWQSADCGFSSNINSSQSDTEASCWGTASTYPVQYTTTSVMTGSATNTETYSWDLGDYIIKNPTATTACSSNNTGLSACTDQFEPVGTRTPSTDPNFYKKNGATYTATEYDAHYLAGNYYQWNAATAGTGGTITDANATGSICPKNWKLPNANSDAKGTFKYLLTQYGVQSSLSGTSSVNSNTYNIALSPLFFVRGGNVDPRNQELYRAGQDGGYWSSRASFDTSYAYYLYFWVSSVSPSHNYSRYNGRSLRCLIPTT